MNYYTDLFTPETWKAFRAHGSTVSGFRMRQKRTAESIECGDILLCYMVRLSRWCGVLEVLTPAYVDAAPIFDNPDPYVVRFKVNPRIIFDVETSIPVDDKAIWPHLSLTQDLAVKSHGWAQFASLRASLHLLTPADGALLFDLLNKQADAKKLYPLTTLDQRRLKEKQSVPATEGDVIVSVPEDEEQETESAAPTVDDFSGEQPDGPRASHRIQATIAKIGAMMGFSVWIPSADRQTVLALVPDDLRSKFLEKLPMNYNDTTLRTIEQIDVIWLKNRSMSRAFEVEHTTQIYSGLLRMADLLALQPNMKIHLHIVAPEERREKVLREISRPIFSLLDGGPLYQSCTYLPYRAITEIAENPQLEHMRDTILDDFEEHAQDD